jgi:hypothetical protein
VDDAAAFPPSSLSISNPVLDQGRFKQALMD